MSDVTLITPPDTLMNNVYSILLVHPNEDTKKQISDLLENVTKPINIYLYEQEDDLEVSWLIQQVKNANMCIIDLDLCSPIVKNLSGWIVAQPNTFYLTNDPITPYNLLNVNRIYDLNWLESTIQRGLNEI